MEIGIDKIQKRLSEKEQMLDSVLLDGRKTVRACSNAIKAMHGHDIETAKRYLAEAEEGIKKMAPHQEHFPSQVNHSMQEYAEALIVLSAIESKKIPAFDDLKEVAEVPYLLALLDAIGELKREMYGALRKGNRGDAEAYFKMMEDLYDELLPLRFSNAILPEFRRKQDVARIQIEHARGELL